MILFLFCPTLLLHTHTHRHTHTHSDIRAFGWWFKGSNFLLAGQEVAMRNSTSIGPDPRDTASAPCVLPGWLEVNCSITGAPRYEKAP